MIAIDHVVAARADLLFGRRVCCSGERWRRRLRRGGEGAAVGGHRAGPFPGAAEPTSPSPSLAPAPTPVSGAGGGGGDDDMRPRLPTERWRRGSGSGRGEERHTGGGGAATTRTGTGTPTPTPTPRRHRRPRRGHQRAPVPAASSASAARRTLRPGQSGGTAFIRSSPPCPSRAASPTRPPSCPCPRPVTSSRYEYKLCLPCHAIHLSSSPSFCQSFCPFYFSLFHFFFWYTV